VRLVLVKGPIGVIIFVVPHNEGMNSRRPRNLEKLCLGICGGEVVVWLVQGGVPDYVMN
jgi:hypothetical protein